jgi:membrane-bound lytic murein transglycosylase A
LALRLAVAAAVLTLSSCAYLPAALPPATAPQPRFVPLDSEACRALLRDDAPTESLQQAVARSMQYLRTQPADRVLTALDRRVMIGDLMSVLNTLHSELGSALPQGEGEGKNIQHLCDRFRLYRAQLAEPVLVTGYYQPELTASRTRTSRFRYPLYRTPDDLVDIDLGALCPACSGRVAEGRVQDGKLVAYYSRAEIDAGTLAGRGLEIAWLDDPVEVFFLHVQGSALLRYDDGVHLQVSYSGSNGLPYTSIGRLLIEQGKIARDAVSLQALKDYLRAHPDEQSTLMAANQRYIFFRTVVAGPVGSLGVPLTAGRSIAADPAVYPRGALVFLHISARDTRSANGDRPGLSRFALIQDAGATIAGPDRLYVFWGTGATA